MGALMNSAMGYKSTRRDARTTDATPLMALEFDVGDQEAGLVVVTAVCSSATRTTVYTVGLQRPYRRNGANVVLAGAGVALYADGDAGLAAIVVAIGVSGSKVQVTITGIAATTIDWLVEAAWSVH